MAYETSAELLAGFKFFAMRPATDESLTDAQAYVLLSKGQEKCYEMFAVHFPEILYGVPYLMTSADSGATYTFGTSVFPYGSVEIRASRNGNLLIPTTDWGEGDYVWEGDNIRIPNGKTRTFSGGPYARFITAPVDISGSQEPTLIPKMARALIMYYALYLWAERGGGVNQADPSRFLGMFQSAWSGDPRIPGDMGILTVLKKQGHGMGMEAGDVQQPFWRGSPDLG
jgi:hypothetical protein